MANPIELLIQLQANKGKSNSNIDNYVKELRKRYESNPLSLNIDTKSANNSFQKLTESAKKLQSELSKVGTVGNDKLTAFSNAITGIGNSSLSTQAKIVHLTRAMNSIKTASNSIKFNEGFADGIQRSVASLNTLEAKLKNMGKGGTVKYDTQSLTDATARLNALRTSLAQVTNPNQLQRLNRQFRELSNDVGTLQGRTNSLGNAFQQAFTKFPVWILAANAFYAPIRGIQDLTKQVIELDTAIVSLSRVDLQPLIMVTL